MADFRVSPGVPREKSKKIYDVRQKFRVFLAIFHEKTRFFGFFGVPVIKEEKAIALRPYDMFFCYLLVRNAMDPDFNKRFPGKRLHFT